jgi:hypothetical protein
MNLALGGNFFNGYPPLTAADVQAWTNPSFTIDYVRVYAKSNVVANPTTSSTIGSTVGSTIGSTVGSTTTISRSATGSTSTGADALAQNQVSANSVNGMTSSQVMLYFYIAVGCSIGSVVLLAVGVTIFAVMWKKQKTVSTVAPIGFN